MLCYAKQRNRKENTDSDSVVYDPVKTRFLESQALFWYETVIRERENKHCDLLVLPLLLEWIFHSVSIAFFVIL